MGYVYCTGPLDFWNGWHDAADIVRERGDGLTEYGEGKFVDKEEFDRCYAELIKKATDMGWEGDIIEGPFVSVFPQEEFNAYHPRIMIAFKQRNNGTCFIYSGWPLVQFENDTAEEWNERYWEKSR